MGLKPPKAKIFTLLFGNVNNLSYFWEIIKTLAGYEK